MATIINNPSERGAENGSGVGIILGIILVVVLALLLLLYGIPGLRGTAPVDESTNTPGANIDVNIGDENGSGVVPGATNQ